MDSRYKVTKIEEPKKKSAIVKKSLLALSIINIIIATPLSIKIAAVAYIIAYVKKLRKVYTNFDHETDLICNKLFKKTNELENAFLDYEQKRYEENAKRSYKR